MTSYRQYSEVFPNHRPDRYGLGDGSGNYQLSEELDMQRHISQQTRSPGFGSAYGSPPTPTKTLTSNHQHLSSQPRGYEANPAIVHQPNASNMIRSASSPVAPYSSGASDPSFYAVSGTALRHDSFNLDLGSASLVNWPQVTNAQTRANSIASAVTPMQFPLPMFSSSTFSTTIPAALPSPQRSPPPQSKPRVRQQHRTQTRTQTDEVIGYVLANKKIFKCPQKTCAELKFGRLADLRRHHDQAHARNRLQFFCPYDGCPRSNAIGGGQGRSFGTRRDKRDEHVKNVHEKDRHSDRFSPEEESY